MNELALLGIIILSAVRLIGLGVSLDYYFETKKRKFKLISFGWLIFFMSGLFVLAINFYNNIFLFEFFLVFNAILNTIGAIFVVTGIISYFIKIPIKIMISYIITILLIVPIFIWFIFDYRIAINFSVVNLNLIYLYVFLLPIFKRNKFKAYMSRSNKLYYTACVVFFLYVPLSIIIVLQGYSFGLYYAENNVLVILNYTIAITITILIIIVFIQIEYSISSQKKNQLKDKYSHDLGNALQAIFSCFDLIDFKNSLNKDNAAILEDILKPKLKEASNLIKEIRNL